MTPALLAWVTLQFAVHVYNAALYYAFERGRIADVEDRALWLRRVGVVLTGLAWGIAGGLWPMHAEGLGVGTAFCLAGLMAGATQTLAGDPWAYVAFGVTAIAPDVLLTDASMSWVAGLLTGFFLVTCYIVRQNAIVLGSSLALRWENTELLTRAIADREAAEAARAEAERAALSKTRFLAAASHDLRQPVQALTLFTDVLAREPEPAREEREQAIAALGRTSEALRSMLEGLFDLSRLDAGLVSASPRPVALGLLLDDTATGLRDEADRSDVAIVVGGRSLTVLADPALLSRVVHNLGSNAVRHSRRGRVLFAIRRRGDHGVVEIWDQGPGIPTGDRERIFEEFVQLKNSERDRTRGLGLGLSMVQRICALQAWPLSFDSTVGTGTVFRIALPLAHEAPPVERRFQTTERPPRGILLVEDDVLLCEATTRFFEADGFRVDAVSNADEAIDALTRLETEGRRPDILVTDHRLPGLITGAALVRQLQQRGEGIPAVLISGDFEAPFLHEPPPPGVAVLRKPVSGPVLLAAVGELLRER